MKKKSPAKGWAKASPKKGKERELLLKKCGKKCFLRPSNLGFPICLQFNSKNYNNNCKKDCRGLLAAKIRARQWKYNTIASKAQKLAIKEKCDWVN
tara:strand:- start:313 stop:600 length:288 start_codon:yes stop_codon:yes gene_type:complete